MATAELKKGDVKDMGLADAGKRKIEWAAQQMPVLQSIRKTRCAVTAEEHNIIGGLGDAIGQAAAKSFPIPIEYVGTNDTFGESGTPDQLLEKYGLTASHIVAAAEKAMARKSK